jgi:hypothetical protein
LLLLLLLLLLLAWAAGGWGGHAWLDGWCCHLSVVSSQYTHKPHKQNTHPQTHSVTFNYLGRDFFNALSEKDVEGFKLQLIKYLCGFVLGEARR